jgi:probable rRNA maturation factor
MTPEVIVGNHQQVVLIPEGWLAALEEVGAVAASRVLERTAAADSPLALLGTVEVALVDDATSSDVHGRFMNLPEPTDVITFHHGEIVIGVEVAARQAAEYGEPLGRELFRYLVHGLLHLAGHEDYERELRKVMEKEQECIITDLWTPALSAKMA